jgi:hypothetical protein
MNNSITLTYRLTEDLWRQFYEAHYSADRGLKVRYAWGAFCILVGALGVGGLYDNSLAAALLLLTGFWGVLSRPLFVLKSVAAARRHPYFNKELTVELNGEEIAVRSGANSYQQEWREFSSYRQVAVGFIFYFKNGSFFFIPAAACSPVVENRIQRLLDQAKLERKGDKQPRS